MKFKRVKGCEMIRKKGNCKSGGIAEQVDKKTNLTMRKFCDIHKLSYESILNGYYSKKTRKIFKEFGIKVA